MTPKNMFIRFLGILLSIVMIASVFTVLPTSVFAAEKDGAEVSANEDAVSGIGGNIPTASAAAPEVDYIAASDKSIAIVFSQYMDIAQLKANHDLITVSENGESVPYRFLFNDRQESPTQAGVFYGRILRITRTDGKFFSGSVAVRIAKELRSCAGTGFAADDERTVPVTQIPTTISHSYPNRLVMYIGDEGEAVVRVTDEHDEPTAGETVTLKATCGDILKVTDMTTVTDGNGVARFPIKAVEAGDEVLIFTVASGAEKLMNVRVKASAGLAPAKPEANLSDYSTVEYGTQLILTCATEGAKIFYTVEGSCPCQEASSQLEYTGPITLTETGFFRITAHTEEGGYSERINLYIYVVEANEVLLGDADENGEIESVDATWIQRYKAEMDLPFTIRTRSADVDGDGEVTLIDATAIQYYLSR